MHLTSRSTAGGRLTAVGGLLLLIVIPHQGRAEESQFVEPTPRQIELYTDAHRAFEEARHEDAVRALYEALDINPINILFLSLGQAYARLGRCRDADWAYHQALTSPPIAEPSPSEVATRVEGRLEELRNDCPGRLELRCSPDDIEIEVDGEAVGSCPNEPLELTRGRHVVIGTSSGRRQEHSVTIEGLRETVLELRFDEVPEEENDVRVEAHSTAMIDPQNELDSRSDVEAAPREEGRGRSRILVVTGAALAGTGGGSLLFSLLADLLWLPASIDEFRSAAQSGDEDALELQSGVQTLQGTVLGTYIAGGVIAVAGLAMLMTGLVRGRRRTREPPSSSLDVLTARPRLEMCVVGDDVLE